MRNETLFISDLHLTIERPEVTRKFIQLLTTRATHAKALYILGDLFDTWIGDDDFSPPINTVKKHLKALTSQGTPIFYIHGNRDFLIGQRFGKQTGVTLLDEYSVTDLYGTSTLLTHGDLLCTDDLPYQAFRIKSHSVEWQENVLSKPLIFRLLYARWYRLRSYFHKRKKSQDIMDVNQETVKQLMEKYQVTRLIHGHTHRPAVHDIQLQGKNAQRFVLAEWKKDSASLLVWSESGYKIEAI
ncbi:UDP-2,3-diacylglucosamine diphosphatase [Methylococcaceae bacterium HT1]|nr:UDP-2,3-diacylglucosamine diphosphatase [Methylococcaceae bacterium HT1]TXL13092.1 UDP-2,3-diacylglucosamine diphosphatase [Methylococcaceae bacterium HT4]TXL15094.1 UDP-2,3-diacylglucosamine diphosphatase [Methylococcaceae bacterium HT3]TXL18932.1 UDP-2,3-diacylglucosamine diphosphatase [Methylococcaceae bacterium HT5]TXL21810.1 UDP-2,3-diacylglucosamine diphosphatase [Methylococcaceae bacterium HT2]